MSVEDWPTNAKIYKIWWRESSDCYVGHTRKPLLSQRMTGHRSGAKRGETSAVYAAIRKNGSFQYDILETVFCQNFDEARTHERRWMRELNANLNGYRPITTKEERKEDIRGYSKVYYAKPEKKAKRKVAMKAWCEKNRSEKRFSCEACQYFASHKGDLTRHQKSKRHLNRQTQI